MGEYFNKITYIPCYATEMSLRSLLLWDFARFAHRPSHTANREASVSKHTKGQLDAGALEERHIVVLSELEQ
jgi:hypothetical protein